MKNVVFALLLFIAFYSLTFSQQYTQKGTEVLAQVFVEENISSLGMPVYAHLQSADGKDYVLVIADRHKIENSGVFYNIIDYSVHREEGISYLVGWYRYEGSKQEAAGIVDILMDDGQHIVARATQQQGDQVAKTGMDIYWLNKPVVLQTKYKPVLDREVIYNPIIDEMLDYVTESEAYNTLAELSGETDAVIGGANYTITTRNTYSGEPIDKATQFVYEFMENLGLQVSYENFTTSNFSNRNVVAELEGFVSPDEIIVVGAHMDDMPEDGLAPGAEDNGSGTVATMLVAKALKDYRFERTIRFVLYTGEEQGLHGSSAHAENAANAGETLIGNFNMDMVAYETDNNPTYSLRIREDTDPGYPGDLELAQIYMDVSDIYSAKIDLAPYINASGGGGSDHISYWNNGFSAIGSMTGEFTPDYHTSDDLISTCNMEHFANVIRGALAFTAEVAIPIVDIMITDFEATPVYSCTGGEVQFTDNSLNAGSWSWDFGDGNTSTDENPLHTYISNGTYTVSLTATNQYGTDTEIKVDYITLELPDSPVVTDGQGCEGESVNLAASGSGDLNWYDAQTGGSLLYTGTTYSTPVLNTTTTYYVEDVIQGQILNVGPEDNTFGEGGYYTYNDSRGLVFDVHSPVTLISVKVYSDEAGDRLIEVRDGVGGNVVTSTTVNIPTGESRIDLNFELDTYTGYHIKVTGDIVNLYRNSSGPSYPYDIDNLVSIIRANADGADYDYYYFFYDWEVQDQECISVSVPVIAEIFSNPATPVITLNGSQLETPSGYTAYQWYFDGSTINGATGNTYTPTGNGSYTVEVTGNNGCSAISDPYTYVGVQEIAGQYDIQIYPNPGSGIFNIDIGNNKSAEIIIYDILGKILLQDMVNSNKETIDMTSLNNGVYFISVRSENTNQVRRVSLIK